MFSRKGVAGGREILSSRTQRILDRHITESDKILFCLLGRDQSQALIALCLSDAGTPGTGDPNDAALKGGGRTSS
jgi:hypothetical protein